MTSTHPTIPRPRWLTDAIVCAAVLIALRLAVSFLGVTLDNPAQAMLFDWPAVAVIIFLGYQGLKGSLEQGLPGIRSASQPLPITLIIGAGVGVALALLGLAKSKLLPDASATSLVFAPGMGTLQALAFFAYGNMATEILMRLGMLSLALWVFQKWPPRQRHWAIIAAVAAVEVAASCYGLWAMTKGQADPRSYLSGGVYFGVVGAAMTWLALRHGVAASIAARVTLGTIAEVIVPRM